MIQPGHELDHGALGRRKGRYARHEIMPGEADDVGPAAGEAMAQVARQLDDHDSAAVAAYFQQVRSSAKAVTQQKE